MSARIVASCQAEIHFPDEGIGRTCSLAEGHDGAHWAMRPIENGYRPVSWEGDDREGSSR